MSLTVLIAAWPALPAWLASVAPWVALGLTSLALIAALRTRWKRTPILTRCVALSLYAHLIFATVAYTTNFMAWRPGAFGSGSGSREVRVRMTSEMPSAEPAADQTSEPEPWEPTGEVPLELALAPTTQVEIKKQDLADSSHAAEQPETPPLPDLPPVKLPDKPPASSPLDSVAEVLAEVAPRYADSMQAAAVPRAAEPIQPRGAAIREPVSSGRSSATPRQSEVPDLYRLRFAEDRAGMIELAGGNANTEAAVQLALEWLVANQEPDGHWNAARHGAGRGSMQQGQDRGDTGADADTGITALAVLSLLGAGHTHLQGEHRVAVQHGLEFLLSSQRSDGCLAGNAKLFASTYCHGMALLALAETLAISHDQRLKPAVERAVAYTVAAQHSGGGWRYQPGDVGDMSQFGWQIMALKSADLAGVKTPEVTQQRAARFLAGHSSGRHGGLASYRSRERPSRTMTAEALLCRHLLVESPERETCEEAMAFVSQELPTSGPANVYYWYYGTLAMRFSGGEPWQRWNEALQRELLESQQGDGSWNPDRVWGGFGGKVYQTSLSALCLEAYYRYDVDAESPRAARR
jgi:hypothetical protein